MDGYKMVQTFNTYFLNDPCESFNRKKVKLSFA
jgi:hypothetical protein